jgi:8-oxo-dGTP pyrophosphatase MutT (NUDIX family)
MNEVWELVDINENKTGVMIERGTNTPIPQGMYHTAVDVWTKSKDGKILLTQRHPNKAWGLKWECSGGAMVAGESPIDSARRELEEEIVESVWDRYLQFKANIVEKVRNMYD